MYKGKVAFLTLGCKVNTYETNAMMASFQEAGYEIVEFSEQADAYVVNTCSVTNMADRKSRQMLHRAKKKNPDAMIIAAGCYVETAKAGGTEDESVDLLIGNQQKGRIVELYEEKVRDRNSVHEFSLLREEKNPGYEVLHIDGTNERTRVFMKIQDGCNQFCSYCIIPYARGRIRSREMEDVLSEARKMVEQGYQEIVLTGIHLSSYGMDWTKETSFAGNDTLISLMEQLNEIEGLKRIRLGSLEPRLVTEEAAERLSRIEKLCPHFHLSLQSGCDQTLLRMNRHYTTKDYAQVVDRLRQWFDEPAITTDVIVGFPGETEEEFEITREFLKKISFSSMHIFKYSVRKGTRAEKMPHQVPEQIKTKRSEALFEIEKRDRYAYEKQLMNGQRVELLVEETMEYEGKTYYVGHTTTYVKIAFPVEGMENASSLENRLVMVCPKERLNDEILLAIFSKIV